MLRRLCASQLHQHGMDMIDIQQLLGHDDPLNPCAPVSRSHFDQGIRRGAWKRFDVSIVGADSAECGLLVSPAVVNSGEFGGIEVEKVVQGISAGCVFGEEVGSGQLVHERPDFVKRHCCQAGHRRRSHIGPGMQAE
ncbi:hypothetical protein [Nonomuraea diastatica]|uniref:hypothetical protein n=1 Tax=Nonomuraea diastatica TaxID=1848329 RepID=UPI003CCC6277